MGLDLGNQNPNLEGMLNAINVVLFSVDPEGRVAGWSEGATRITGFEAGDLVGRDLAFLDTDEQGVRLSALWQRIQEGESFAEGTINLRGKDNRMLYLLADLRRLDEEGEFAGAVGTMCDLSLHVRVNNRLSRIEPQARPHGVFQDMVGESAPMREVADEIRSAAQVDVTVLIRGETGTGKELAARAIHALSPRRDKPLVCVSCSAIPDPLLESELFGHVKGAFTGAVRDKKGVFEAAAGGVLFLDEIGDLGPAVQVKLLRALQEREIRRVGADRAIKVDVRVVSATHRDLAAMVAAGEFREDLYYRVRVFELRLPPLRERPGDIPLLIDHLVTEFSDRHGKPVEGLSPEATARLERYPWPGNIRELRNALEHSFVRVRGGQIALRDLPTEFHSETAGPEPLPPPPPVAAQPPPPGMSASETDERSRIIAALRHTGGKKTATAKLLGMSRVTLWKRIKRYGISPVYEGF